MTEEDLKTFDFTSVDITELLPQRKPFVMISSLLSCSYQRTVTRFREHRPDLRRKDRLHQQVLAP